MMRTIGRVLGLAVLVTAVSMTASPAGSGTSEVASFDVTFTDTSRPTDATSAAPASDERVLVTTITYPEGADRKLPLLVLAHGNSGHPRKFLQLVGAWASAGYVVAAPAFPLTTDVTPGGSQPGDVDNQPADMTFVIDEVLKLGRKGADSPIAGLVDKRHIGVAGLSLGGGTIYGLVFHTCCIDKRVDAAILMSALKLNFTPGDDDFRHVPALLVHGDADGIYRVSEQTYPLLATPKWFVTLHGSTHSAPFEDSVDPADEVVPVITTAFFDRYLKGQKAAAKRLVAAVDDYGNAEVQRELK
jgi:dienelactone hydrolase